MLLRSFGFAFGTVAGAITGYWFSVLTAYTIAGIYDRCHSLEK